MMKNYVRSVRLLSLVLVLLTIFSCTKQDNIRFATFNSALNRQEQGMLTKDLKLDSEQGHNVAAIIQKVRPDVLCLQEFDYDPSGKTLELFMRDYLEKGDNPIKYPYFIAFPSNTGVLSNTDINKDGKIALPEDGYGFGAFPGQYGFVILSKYPILKDQVRTFQKMKWKDMPNPLWPVDENGNQWFDQNAKEDLRISSKSHVDVPIQIDKHVVHAIVAHPTPPVFDGKEDRNGKRNHDEIRLLKDYIEGESYMIDDNSIAGGIKKDALFVVMGDMNADPQDGDSFDFAILTLLHSQKLNPEVTLGEKVPTSKGSVEYNKTFKRNHKGDDAMDTNVFGLRIDYVLPSSNLNVIDSKVFWNEKEDKDGILTYRKNSSDHRLVWTDISFKTNKK